jgi:ABC-type transport system involved in cytochrome c biogenesis ATPase subunit
MESVVYFSEAVAVHGRFPVLTGASLTVNPCEIVLLRGPNGAGKTSLLRACAGLLSVVQGTARVLGVDLTLDRRAVRSRVGLLSHANGLYDDLTVTENVRFWGRTAGASDDEVNAAMSELGLSGRLATVKVVKLSAGQRRRTALATVLARRPELWLLASTPTVVTLLTMCFAAPRPLAPPSFLPAMNSTGPNLWRPAWSASMPVAWCNRHAENRPPHCGQRSSP